MLPRAASRTLFTAIGWLFLVVVAVAGCGGAAAPGLPPSSDDGGAATTPDASGDAGLNRGDANIRTNGDATAPPGDAAVPTSDATVPAADAMSCGASTCPTGCCDKNGRCQAGDSLSGCGKSGAACQDCTAGGFKACDATSRACYSDMGQCNTTNCKGCCVQNVCFAGTDSADCGSGGRACQSCAADGLVCTGQQCAKPSCGPGNCTGCCVGTQCLVGTDPSACGQQGLLCTDCNALGSTCAASVNGVGGACSTACGPATCPTGCCDSNNVCQQGSSPTACGQQGGACRICSAGTACSNKRCACDSTTCPTGCCTFARGVGGGMPIQTCELGTSDTTCGSGSVICQNCTFTFPSSHCVNQQCNVPPPCLCTTGCCDSLGRCQPGASNTMCGPPGNTCQDCTQTASTLCEAQQCTFVTDVDAGACNEQSCPSGCCDSAGVCQQGVTSLNCGGFGTNCQNCLQTNTVCSTQQCTTPPDAGTVCNPANCNGCCDPQGNCLGGYDEAQCGFGGRRCLDCSTLGAQCEFGSCTTPDGSTPCSQSCAGCCDVGGNCQNGYANTQCGELGNRCQDCTSLTPASTCDVVVSPRTCVSQQTQCPAPYTSCPAPLQQQAPARQKVCSALDLQNAAGACAGGAYSTACTAFLQQSALNAGCGLCLEAFDWDFVEQVGTRTCVAPFLSATCNHNSACIADCVQESCYNCPDQSSTSQCEAQAPSGTCSSFSQADQCVATALAGPGAVCNPAAYQGNFGAWLQAVGALYCGM